MNTDKRPVGRPPQIENAVKAATSLPADLLEWIKETYSPRNQSEAIRFALEDLRQMENPGKYQLDPRHRCGACGHELQIVRPGKYQCVNDECCYGYYPDGEPVNDR